jgi:UDP-N-acetylglucosamine 2-epimerase (non-hydrolysing)
LATFLVVFGTRPEAIKLAPVILRLRSKPGCKVVVCVTAQQREMLDQVLEIFAIKPEIDLDLMRPAQTLGQFAGRAIPELERVMTTIAPDMVVVQGDTSTTFLASLAAYYCRVPIAHVEAGLRTGDLYSPFPEEINRVLTSDIAALHFAPTERAAENLLREGQPRERVFVTGNTSIDALLMTAATINEDKIVTLDTMPSGRRIVLITAHRRESFGQGFDSICGAIAELVVRCPRELFVYPAHLNPNVQDPVGRILRPLAERVDNLHIIEPLAYREFVALMKKSYLILTDSGGIQEEAPGLGKPVLVLRDTTERQEAIEGGTARLVGTETDVIVRETMRLLEDTAAYSAMACARNPYGDGKAAERIADHCCAFLQAQQRHEPAKSPLGSAAAGK